jgi:hypothetical protein
MQFSSAVQTPKHRRDSRSPPLAAGQDLPRRLSRQVRKCPLLVRLSPSRNDYIGPGAAVNVDVVYSNADPHPERRTCVEHGLFAARRGQSRLPMSPARSRA